MFLKVNHLSGLKSFEKSAQSVPGLDSKASDLSGRSSGHLFTHETILSTEGLDHCYQFLPYLEILVDTLVDKILITGNPCNCCPLVSVGHLDVWCSLQRSPKSMANLSNLGFNGNEFAAM